MLVRIERITSTRPLRSSGAPICATTAEAMRTTFSGLRVWLRSATGLLPVRLNILVSIGAIDLLSFYGRPLGQLYPVAMYSAAATWLLAVLVLGFAARSGRRWAFLAGMVLYGADMIVLIAMFSLWAFGVHAFFLFKWFQGQQALKDLNDASVLTV